MTDTPPLNEIEKTTKRLEKLREAQKARKEQRERDERRAYRKAEMQAALFGLAVLIAALVLLFEW